MEVMEVMEVMNVMIVMTMGKVIAGPFANLRA